MKLLVLLFVFISCSSWKSGVGGSKISALRGPSDEKNAQFSFATFLNAPLKFEIQGPGDLSKVEIETKIYNWPNEEGTVYQLLIKNLPDQISTKETMGEEESTSKTQKKVTYTIVATGNDGKNYGQWFFSPFNNSGESIKFISFSCANDDYKKNQKKIYQSLFKENPEWLFLIGDNVYVVDSKEGERPEIIWRRYFETRMKLEFYYQENLIPVSAIWDDNDYGMPNGNETYTYKEESKKIFDIFFPNTLPLALIEKGPGLSHVVKLRGMHFALLDNRSFRSIAVEGKHFGQEQEDWLFEQLKSQLPTWIISGDQFFGGYHQFESFEGSHPQNFETFISRIKEVNTPYVFMSGDRHLSEILQFPRALLGQLSYEFTTSPIHSKTYSNSLKDFPSPWRVVGKDDVHQFMSFETKLTGQSWDIKARALGINSEEYFERDFSIFTEELKDFAIEKRYRRRRFRRRR